MRDVIEDTFAANGIKYTYQGTRQGPTVHQYLYTIPYKTTYRRVANLEEELTFRSGKDVLVSHHKATLIVEMPADERQTVDWQQCADTQIYFGKDINNADLIFDITRSPHLLVAGTTGSGKSVFLNAMVWSLIKQTIPDDCRLVLIDPKQVEFKPFDGYPHLLYPPITDMSKAKDVLCNLVDRMEYRYHHMSKQGCKSIDEYRNKGFRAAKLFCVVDELADLILLHRKKVEIPIVRIAQKARAVGIHLILATQRPSTDVVTGLIKSNLPTRVCFRVNSVVDSRVVIDRKGGEKLQGFGDALFYPSMQRFQACYLPARVVEKGKCT